MEISLLDVAQHELDEAVKYYNVELPGLGDQFLLEVLSAFERIRQFPYAWHSYTENTRHCRTRRFPYGIVYQVFESEILVVAVAHMHRRPVYWRDRLG